MDTQHQAEKKCNHIFAGAMQWSPQVKEVYDLLNFWSMAVDLGTNKKISKLSKQYGLIDPQDLAEARHGLKLAHKYCRKVKRDNILYRLEFLSKLAEAQEEYDNHSSSHYLLQFQQKEAVQKSLKWIKFVTNKLQKLSTTFVMKPNADSTVEEIMDKQALELAIIEENLKKYHQIEMLCPLIEDQILQDIRTLGDGPEVENILNSSYIPPTGMSKPVDTFLKCMQRSSKIPLLEIEDCLMSQKEFVSNWRRVKTATSLIGLHIGHYKVDTQHPKLAQLFHLKLEIPFLEGFALTRYRKGLDIMIMKKAESHGIGDLRTVVLFDSEANHGNKWIGKFSMNTAIQHEAVAMEQYSRPGCSAEDHALNRKLTFDHHKFRR